MGARIVKQKYNVNNNNTNKNVMIPKKINKKTIEYREYVNKNVSKILLNTNNNRNDIYCKLSIDPQKDANNILNVLDYLLDTIPMVSRQFPWFYF